MKWSAFCLIAVLAFTANSGDRPGTNSDESKVKEYTLPDALVSKDGTRITDTQGWWCKRRPELVEIFASQMHGHMPPRPCDMWFQVESCDKCALGGSATRKEVAIHLGCEADAAQIHLLIYIPNGCGKHLPALIMPNFNGNHTIDADPGITLRDVWLWNGKTNSDEFAKADPKTRGSDAKSWEVATIIKRGYALVTFARHEVEPDYATGWKHGVRGWWLKKSGKTEFAPDDWGCIAAWAWADSRALDYLETDRTFDARRVAVLGHSRLGKAALCAGAFDQRFAMTVSNDSGEGGAALARRWFGETTAVINKSFPHWFDANYKQYGDKENSMPMDEHELIALIAPRAAYVASAEDDKWADPKGEFLSAKHAGPVYKLFGLEGVGVEEQPAVNHLVGSRVGYHMRTGKHDVTAYDWEQYLNFADRNMPR